MVAIPEIAAHTTPEVSPPRGNGNERRRMRRINQFKRFPSRPSIFKAFAGVSPTSSIGTFSAVLESSHAEYLKKTYSRIYPVGRHILTMPFLFFPLFWWLWHTHTLCTVQNTSLLQAYVNMVDLHPTFTSSIICYQEHFFLSLWSSISESKWIWNIWDGETGVCILKFAPGGIWKKPKA